MQGRYIGLPFFDVINGASAFELYDSSSGGT